ncbi:hypothetical protein EDC19_0825 [Natranaerovirga hydrolytica]|uniref:Uncharacterized protein n=1 Tax=Natranaerovirga hydrolytica TaxID=680378 RepID=A0A4R1MZ17_9FIRM|nr:hypothetical protein [Natranaerovirga hydrolytica]TCK98405.1 hypothetical protein EDC19_0825 [Natranaerovirga hydrolytica]
MQDYYSEEKDPNESIQPPNPATKHSGVGIASFVISLIVGVIMFANIMYAGYVSLNMHTYDFQSLEAVLLIVGAIMILSLIICLVGLGLGIAGLIQKNRKRVFSILGVVFNGLGLLFMLIMLLF